MPSISDVRWVGSDRTSAVRLPSVACAVVTIAAFKSALLLIGLGRTLRWMRRRAQELPARASVSPDQVALCEYTVALAAALYPGRAMCLERSLALFYLARRAGIPVTYHQGVQPRPFAAHAWIEYQGAILNDVPEHVHTFRPFPQVCP